MILSQSIVEFAGIPGAGKSTLYRASMSDVTIRWRMCCSLDDVLRVSRFDRIRAALEWVPVRRLLSRNSDVFRVFYRTYIPDICTVGEHVKDSRPDAKFIRFCLGVGNFERQSPFHQLRGLKLLIQVLEQYWAVESMHKDSRFIICEEGLTQRVHSVIAPTEQNASLVASYFDLMLQPRAVIFVSVSPDIAWRRIQDRRARTGRVALRHVGRSEGDICTELSHMHVHLEKGVAILKSRGVDVLELNALEPVQANVKAIKAFVGELG